MQPSDPLAIRLAPRLAGCRVPLTPMQLRSWKQLTKGGLKPVSLRTCAASVRILGTLNTSFLRRSIQTVVQRHESLRTRIVLVEGTPTQHIDAACDNHLEVIDVAKISRTNIEREARRLAQDFVEEQIDLSVGPLFAAKLFRLSDQDHVLILSLDHIVSDAVSYVILSREIWTLYNQAVQAQPPSLPQLSVQFADYAVWQQRTHGAWLVKNGEYWKRRLTGAPHLLLPIDNDLAEAEHPGAMLHFPFDKTLSARLHEVARRERTLLPILVLTLFVAVVSRWSNQRDFVLTFVSHGRHGRPELENMIGLLANFLHFRIEVSEDDSCLDLLKRVNLEFYSAYQHQDFDRVPDFIPDCGTELYFNWIPNDWTRRPAHQNGGSDGHIKIQPFPMQPFLNWVDMSLKFAVASYDTPAGIVMGLWYRSDLFARSTIERLGRSLVAFAEELTQRPLSSVVSVSLTL